GETLLVEHGAGDDTMVWDCVRHAHVHVVPGLRSNVATRVEAVVRRYMNLTDVVQETDQAEIRRRVSDRSEYLWVSGGGVTWIGQPMPGVRHGSRALIAD